MSSTELLQPILEGGIRSVKFFNGRLLSGEDLSDEQAANREGRKRLGQALGEGVAFGLEVSEATGLSQKDAPVVTINAGMAVNRQGQTLKLAAPASISLIRQSVADTPATNGGTFKDCQQMQLQSGVYIAGAGVYLLTIAPAEGSAGRAPVSGLGNTTITCNARYTVEGAQFRLLQLNISSKDLSDPKFLRNRVAYKCFGTSVITGSPSEPQSSQYGLLDALRPNVLTDYDVPLALIYWTATGGITFLDQWSVRRRLTARAASDRWAHLLGDRRASETEAMILQFEEHIQDILSKESKEANTIVAKQRFDYLPPVGLLPVIGSPPHSPPASSPSSPPPGFDPARFFMDIGKSSIMKLDNVYLRRLFHEALYHDPIDLKSSELIGLLEVRRNPNALVFVSQSLGRSLQHVFDE
jgi:hypothetical protein